MTENIEHKNWYDKHYKLTIILPVLLLVFSIVYLFIFASKNGDIIYKDVSLTGGTTITVLDTKTDIKDLENYLVPKFGDVSIRKISELRSGVQNGFILETKAKAEDVKIELESYLGYKLTSDNSSIEFSGAALSTSFYKQLRFAIIIAFVLMAIVVFLIFRTFVPSFAIVLSAFADILMTITAVDLFKMNLSIAGIISFLMLIGYSVDTDILLTSRLLKKREGAMNSVLFGAFKTGMTMTLTSIAAAGISLIVTYSASEILRQMFTIILIGLGFDIVNTWLTNAPMLRWYIEIKEGRK